MKHDERPTEFLVVKPYFKPTQRAPILNSSSSHLNYVHKSWPMGRYRDFEQLSSSPHYTIAAKRTFLQKLRWQQPSHPAISSLQSSLVSVPSSGSAKRQSGSWLVLPFHPAWLPLQATVNAIASHWNHLHRAYGRCALVLSTPGISCTRGNKFLMQALYREHRREE